MGDYNGDDIQDAVVASYHHTEVLMLLGGRSSILTGFLSGGEHPWDPVAPDLNGDGRDDFVVTDDGKKIATIYLSLDQCALPKHHPPEMFLIAWVIQSTVKCMA